jgi:hypothetical protein
MISGDNSDYINVFNSGTDWWALQVRTDEFPGQQQGDIFEVSFKAASSVATAFDFKAQGQLDFTYRVELPGNEEVKDFKFQTTPMDGNGFIVFFFALGKVPAGEYWFDAVKIVRKDETAIGHIALTENAPYTVYNLSGLAVARGITNGEAIATDNLASGVYILKTANRILKFVKQ